MQQHEEIIRTIKLNEQTISVGTKKRGKFQSKQKKEITCLKSVYGVATYLCNKCSHTTWHVVKCFFNVCLWKGILYYLYVQSKLAS